MKTFIARAVLLVPDVIPHLKSGYYKSFEYFLATLESMISNVYDGFMGNEFMDILGNLLGGQLLKAYEQAWEDSGMTTFPLPDFLQSSLDTMLAGQGAYIEPFYRDILIAGVDKTPIEPLLSRADMWATRYNEAYNQATALIVSENGGNLIWRFGDTDHCTTCEQLDGLVAYASEWEELGVRPQNAPNDLLECGGWRCACQLLPTDQRRSPRAFESIMNIVNK